MSSGSVAICDTVSHKREKDRKSGLARRPCCIGRWWQEAVSLHWKCNVVSPADLYPKPKPPYHPQPGMPDDSGSKRSQPSGFLAAWFHDACLIFMGMGGYQAGFGIRSSSLCRKRSCIPNREGAGRLNNFISPCSELWKIPHAQMILYVLGMHFFDAEDKFLSYLFAGLQIMSCSKKPPSPRVCHALEVIFTLRVSLALKTWQTQFPQIS